MEKNAVKLRSFLPLTQETLTIATKTAILILAAIVVFYQDLAILFNDALQDEATSYILAIPFILAYVVYRKRKMIKAAISLESPRQPKIVSTNELVGVQLIVTSLILYWYGSNTFSPLEYHIFALPIFTSACILLLFNTQTLKQLIFPTAFLFLLVPPPAEILYYLGAMLSTISSGLVYNMLKIFGFPANLTTEYGTPVILITQQSGTTISFAVDIACSGVYSQIGFFVFAIFIAYLIRDKIWKKASIFLLGFPLIYLLNVLRIFSIVIIGYYYGVNLALSVFHLFGGWTLIFLGTLLLLLTSEKLLKTQILGKQTEKCLECNMPRAKRRRFCFECGRIHKTDSRRISKRDVAKLAALGITVILVLSIQVPVFAITEGPAEIVLQTPKGQEVTTEILPQIPEYTLAFVYRDLEFEQLAKQDAALQYAYFPNDNTKKVIWITIEIASSRSALHRQEVCLITIPITLGDQPRVDKIELEDVRLLENPPIISRYFVYQWIRPKEKANITEAVLYWYETSSFKIDSTSGQKHVKISVIMQYLPSETVPLQQTREELFMFGKAIAEYWQPIEPWSQIALFLSRSGAHLFLVVAVALGATVFFQVFNQTKTRRTNFRVYQKLSKENQAVMEAIYHARKMPTLRNITTTYKNLSNKPMTATELVERLEKAEDAGLVKQQIINAQDEPVLGWKPQFSPKIRKQAEKSFVTE